MKDKDVDVRSAVAEVADHEVTVRLVLHNQTDRSAYAYGTPRKIEFDGGSGTLRVILHDQTMDPVLDPHLLRPTIVELPAGADTELAVTLPRTLRRMRSREEIAGGGPLVELITPGDATNVDLEVAYADTPFYHAIDERTAGQQLREWTGGILTTRVPLSRGKPPVRRRPKGSPG